MSAHPSPHAVILVDCDYNRYSLAVLTGILEEDERFRDLDLYFPKLRPKTRRNSACSPRHFGEYVSTLASRYQRVVVGFSFPTAKVIEIQETVKIVRDNLHASPQRDNVLIIAGGPHPSGDPVGTLLLGADVVVVGEGELTFPNLLERYFSQTSYRNLPGLGFLDEAGKYHCTERPPFVDISDFPPFALRHKRFCPIEMSRGCPWGCSYCQTSFLMGRRMRHRSIESLVTYADAGHRLIGLRVLRFIAPNAFAYGSADGCSVNLDALETLLKTVSPIYGKEQVFLGSFPSEVRPEHVSPETLELVRQYCANDNLAIGAQSGSERLLQAMHRGHGVDVIVRAVELTLNGGFIPNVDFIFGLPSETAQDRDATLALMERLVRMGARIHSHTFMPLVGTPFAACPPGVVDPQTRRVIERLRGRQQAHGYWKQQEQIARATTAFLAGQERQKSVEPLSAGYAGDYSRALE